jgi:VWFA-related protein
MYKHVVIAATLSLSSIAGHAQSPTFRAETTAVQLPVRVLDAKGMFVTDLTAADIEVLEDGVPQTISDFTLVDLEARAKRAPTVPATPTGALSIPQLEKLEGRMYVFLIDDYHLNVLHTPRAKQLVRSFISDRMTPGDAAAVVVASGAARQDFTHDKRALQIAVDRVTGGFDADEPLRAREAKARSLLKLVADLSGALAQIRGRHKSLIYVGPQMGCRVSLETSRDMDVPVTAPAEGFQLTTGDQILCHEQIWDTARAAVQGNVSMYSIDPRGQYNPSWIGANVDGRNGPDAARQRSQSGEPGRPSVFDGFYVLSDHTGGFAVTGTTNYRDPFDRIVRESSTYYLLAYTSSNNKTDGKYRKTQVNVKRPGVQAFYRSGYMARRP